MSHFTRLNVLLWLTSHNWNLFEWIVFFVAILANVNDWDADLGLMALLYHEVEWDFHIIHLARVIVSTAIVTRIIDNAHMQLFVLLGWIFKILLAPYMAWSAAFILAVILLIFELLALTARFWFTVLQLLIYCAYLKWCLFSLNFSLLFLLFNFRQRALISIL